MRTGRGIFPLLLDLSGNGKLLEHNTSKKRFFFECRNQKRGRALQDKGKLNVPSISLGLEATKSSKMTGRDSGGGLQEPQFNHN